MDRRKLLTGAALAAATLGAAGCKRPTWDKSGDGTGEGPSSGPAVIRRRRELKMVTTWPKNFPGLGTAAEKFATRITQMTDGAITVKLYAAGELVPPFESFDAVSGGTADIYHAAEYYWQGRSKAFNFFCAVPFGLTAAEMDAWIQHGGGQQLWDELAARFNIKPLPCGNSGVQAGGWYTREINTMEDFKGLKIRMPGLGGEVMRRVGAAPVTLPGGEIFQSLQTGAIDATEWVGPWNDLAFGFYRAAKYYYLPGFHEPGTLLGLGINLDLWRSFSTAEKAIFTTAAQAQNMDSFAEFNMNNARALRTLIDDHGVEVRTFSDDIFRELGRVSHEVLEDIASEDELTGRVYQSYLAARANGMEWGPRSDEGYTRVRRLYTPGE